jgi:hypothetical protein
MRFTRDCLTGGFKDETVRALDEIRLEGRKKLDGARDSVMQFCGQRNGGKKALDVLVLPVLTGSPETALFNYYTGLFLIASEIAAAKLGFQVVTQAIGIDETLSRRAAVEANVAEELLVRISEALFFAVRNANGAEFKVIIAQLRALQSSGRTDEVEARIADLINTFYVPRPYRSFLLSES